jgi:hypothetical protein
MHTELTWLLNYLLFSESLEAIDPAVADTVTELLLLPVENMLRRGTFAESTKVQRLHIYAGYLKRFKELALVPWAGKAPPRRRTPSSSPTSQCGQAQDRTASQQEQENVRNFRTKTN